MPENECATSDRPPALSRRQLAFIHHKILYEMNDKDAAIEAGYAVSVAENTLQKIWPKPGVRAEFERLKKRFHTVALQNETREVPRPKRSNQEAINTKLGPKGHIPIRRG